MTPCTRCVHLNHPPRCRGRAFYNFIFDTAIPPPLLAMAMPGGSFGTSHFANGHLLISDESQANLQGSGRTFRSWNDAAVFVCVWVSFPRFPGWMLLKKLVGGKAPYIHFHIHLATSEEGGRPRRHLGTVAVNSRTGCFFRIFFYSVFFLHAT